MASSQESSDSSNTMNSGFSLQTENSSTLRKREDKEYIKCSNHVEKIKSVLGSNISCAEQLRSTELIHMDQKGVLWCLYILKHRSASHYRLINRELELDPHPLKLFHKSTIIILAKNSINAGLYLLHAGSSMNKFWYLGIKGDNEVMTKLDVCPGSKARKVAYSCAIYDGHEKVWIC